jgi:hypothetical protein
VSNPGVLFVLIILHSLYLEYGSADSPPPPDGRLGGGAPLHLLFLLATWEFSARYYGCDGLLRYDISQFTRSLQPRVCMD